MNVTWLIVAILLIGVVGFTLGTMRANKSVQGDASKLHSRTSYYGYFVLIWAVLPALAVMVAVLILKPVIVAGAVASYFPADVAADDARSNLTAGVVEQVAQGLERLSPEEFQAVRIGVVTARTAFAEKGVSLGGEVEPFMIDAAQTLNSLNATFALLGWVGTIAAAAVGLFLAYRQIAPQMRARNSVERVVLGLLIAAAVLAILTTASIVFSLLYESMRFFSVVSPLNFFFGTVWDPRFAGAGGGSGEGQFGLLPLLWGTLYITVIAMIIAVPIGLFSAIYMSEYASKPVRAVVKPALEVLAGIPTIVYGFFALSTVGPFIRDVVAIPLGLGESGSSVMTAGVVMGIMIIPFVSSLSDDIINAVPQSMRDGSYGLGATKSETIRQVVLPAALPGIVGAVLLAVSRAVGETMIVVLAAGVAARISLNPFLEMSTITVRIVKQLTGDTEFTSPETLVAFALGLTLFCFTLGLNIFALHIVRKYREQYD